MSKLPLKVPCGDDGGDPVTATETTSVDMVVERIRLFKNIVEIDRLYNSEIHGGYAGYWGLLSIVSFHGAWDWWVTNERRLFQWKWKRFYHREMDVLGLLSLNGFETLLRANAYNPTARDMQMYNQRNSNGNGGGMTLCFRIPLFTEQLVIPQAVASSDEFDIIRGRVHVGHGDLRDWVWNTMEMCAQSLYKCTHKNREMIIRNDPFLAAWTAPDSIVSTTLFSVDEIIKRRSHSKSGMVGNGVELPDVIVDDIEDMGKTHFPPCVAKIIWQATQYGQHPKNAQRVVLTSFLLDLGYEVGKIEEILLKLYMCESDNEVRTVEALRKKFQVSYYTKNGRKAYGCRGVKRAGLCPLVNAGTIDNNQFLHWFMNGGDSVKGSGPNEKCSFILNGKAPSRHWATVSHPNGYARFVIINKQHRQS